MNTLIIFLKYPEPGKVKTRLAKDLGEEQAASLYSIMVKTILKNVPSDSYNTVIYYDPPDKKEEVKTWIGEVKVRYSPQVGNTLGDRITNAFKREFADGSGKAAIIGTDCVDVTTDIINQTMELLDGYDVVIGPAQDGGYYLLGLRQFYPYIFEDIEWSTNRVLDQTIGKITGHKLKYSLLKTLKDIDTVDNLKEKVRDLSEFEEDTP